jgi:hypothetical protein
MDQSLCSDWQQKWQYANIESYSCLFHSIFSCMLSLIRNQLRTIFWKEGLINCLFSTAKSSSLRGFLAFILWPHLFHIVLLTISSSNIAIDLINELRRKLLLLLIRCDYHHRWSCGLRVFLRINYPTSRLLPWLLYLVKVMGLTVWVLLLFV